MCGLAGIAGNCFLSKINERNVKIACDAKLPTDETVTLPSVDLVNLMLFHIIDSSFCVVCSHRSLCRSI